VLGFDLQRIFRHTDHHQADVLFNAVYGDGLRALARLARACGDEETAAWADGTAARVTAALVERCVRDCIRVGLLDPSDALLTSNEIDIPYAQVVDARERAECVATIREWVASFDIVLAGRFGEWARCDSDHAFIAGRTAAEAVQRLTSTHVAAKSA